MSPSLVDATELASLLTRVKIGAVYISEGRSSKRIAQDARRVCTLAKAVHRSNEWLSMHEENEFILQRRKVRVEEARRILLTYATALDDNSNPKVAAFELTFPSGGKVWY